MKAEITLIREYVTITTSSRVTVEELLEFLQEFRTTSMWEDARDKYVIFSSPSSLQEPPKHQPGMNYVVPVSDS